MRWPWAFAVLLFGPLVNLAAAADQRPNILFVFSDDHATHAISAYGSRINSTPSIDRLADEGMLFTNAFVTNSICGPSRAVILTGKHSHMNGFVANEWGGAFDGSQQTFPKLLRQAGYETALIGKWHLHGDPTGFDHWEILPGQGRYYNPRLRGPNGTTVIEGYTTDVITDRAIDWLRGRDNERPFLLMYQHKAPHREWAPGPDHLDMYRDGDTPEPATLFDDHAGRAGANPGIEMSVARHMSSLDLKLQFPGYLNDEQRVLYESAYGEENARFEGENPQGDARTRWKYQRYIKDYLRSVASIDDNLGRVLDFLDEQGLAENTIVVYSSDQGFFLGDHGWYDKRWMYEESLRAPLIVRWPGRVPAGTRRDELVQNLDFAQTFLDAAGVEQPADMQGRSLLPLLSSTAQRPWRDSIYYHFYENPGWSFVPRHYGVRTERYKLIHYYRLDQWELFDLERDPDELENRVYDPALAQVRAELERELQRLRTHYRVPEHDPEPTWWENFKFRAMNFALGILWVD
jgi:arylsulfatase A-like enzyme